MSGPMDVLRGWLGPDEADPGCERTFASFELVIEADLAGRPAAELFPAAAAHLRNCPDCREDYAGLRALVADAAADADA